MNEHIKLLIIALVIGVLNNHLKEVLINDKSYIFGGWEVKKSYCQLSCAEL